MWLEGSAALLVSYGRLARIISVPLFLSRLCCGGIIDVVVVDVVATQRVKKEARDTRDTLSIKIQIHPSKLKQSNQSSSFSLKRPR